MVLGRLGLLRQRDYLNYWSASTVSLFGTQVSQLAIPVVAVLVLNASQFEVGLLVTFEFLPWIFFTLPAGVWVDRLPRRRILIAGDLGRAIMLSTIPIAFAAHVLTIWQLYVVGFVNGVLTVFFDVADQSYLPTVVERDDLVEGNAKLQVSASSAQILGQPVGGGIVSLLTAPMAVIVDAASFVGSALLILGIRRREPALDRIREADAPRPQMRGEIVEGLRYVFGNRLLRSIAACTGSANLFNNIVFAIYAVFVYRDLGLSPAQVGLLGGIGGFGVLVGALIANRVAIWLGVGRTILISAMLFGPAGLFIPLASGETAFAFLAAAWFLQGVLNVIYNVNQVSLRQAITPERLLGRLNGTMRFVVWGTIPIGSVIGGVLATVIGTRTAIWVGSLLALTVFLPILFSSVPALKKIPEQPAEPGGARGPELTGGAMTDLGHAGASEPSTYPDR